MNLAAFQTLRRGLQHNAVPVTSQVRSLLVTGLREELTASGLFEDLELGSSDDLDRLVLGVCVYRGDVSEGEVAAAIGEAWAAVAFHHWSAHAFLAEDGHVELQAASLDRPGGRFASVHLVAQRTSVAAAPADSLADASVRGLVSAA